MTDGAAPSRFCSAANLETPSSAGLGFGLGSGGESTFFRHAGQSRPAMRKIRVEQCGQFKSADMNIYLLLWRLFARGTGPRGPRPTRTGSR